MVQHDTAPRPFTEFLIKHRRGGLQGDLAEALQQVATAVDEQQKPGKLVLTIDVKPNNGSGVMVTDKLDVKGPAADEGRRHLLRRLRGRLTKDLPNQETIDDELERRRAGGDA